ncbi:MAG: 1-acyl-sn-glycerol-3-phosphate acyltransferase [Deltaproteobacteria bacterium]|nr:1-acyl-sn-glycerol-3-phosphate acyltransferase [Deltaproteobacteria bacterium]
MKRSPLVFNLTRLVSGLVLPSRFEVRIRGLDHLPEKGPALLIPKHQQWWDVPLLGHYIPRPLYFLAKQELFRSPVARYFISRLGGIPVDRQAPLKSLNTFRSLGPLIKGDAFLVLFPEGTYFPKAMGPGKWRLVRMILSFQQKQDWPTLSFLPVGIRYHSTAAGGKIMVELRIGEARQEKDPGKAQAFTEGLLEEVRKLSQL